MEQSGLAAAVEFAEGVWDLSLEHILEFRLTEECMSMYYEDGSKRRSTKNRLLQHLNYNTVDIPKEYISIVDMGFIWCLTTAEGRETTKGMVMLFFGQIIGRKSISLVLTLHPAARTVILLKLKSS